MVSGNSTYRAIISSDWNECLAPCGPFDFISFNYPQLTAELETIFKHYTGNIISLGQAIRQIRKLLSTPITVTQMDAYLDESFTVYPGVPELIEWCLNNDILFMLNTTGMIGYFQRIFARGLLPRVPALTAHPMVRYGHQKTDPETILDLFEIKDKAANTEAVVRSFHIPADKIILMGDSGGDGPHFKWGAENSALLIGSMTKPSLKKYCARHHVKIGIEFGTAFKDSNQQKKLESNFLELLPVIEDFLHG